ncbi:MAG TPA: glycosyltransferase family 39 protein [Bryobacteraceae bacterium]|nr:glycosyltransferase family 39 protein [Bryobacteraceae bacterium]
MKEKRSGLLDLLLLLTLVCCIVRLWIMPLGSSLWVDEMGTYFVVHHGANDPSLRVAPQVAASIYYILPAFAERVAGFSEVSYRFFSVVAMAGALLAITMLAGRVFHPGAAWFAAFACLTSRGFNYQADDARPYALGTLVLAVAILLEVRWLDSGRWRDGLFFAAAASVLWWVHLIFWPFYLIFVIYAWFRLHRNETDLGWWQASAIFAAICCAVVPVAIRALSLLREASAHVVVPRPGLGELLLILKWKALLLTGAGAFILSRILNWKAPQAAWVSRSSAVLILGWWLIDPISLFAFSWITGNSVFVARYLYLALPGVILTSAMLVAFFVPARCWKPVALALGVGVLVSMGHWRELWPAHHPSDWRGAASALRNWTAGDTVPVICPSPFIEAQPPVWRPDYPVRGFLYSNLGVYPMAGSIYPFPFTAPPFETPLEVADYAQSLSTRTLAPAGRFAIYGGDVAVHYWQRWFASRPELHGWQSKRLGKFGDVEVAVFSNREYGEAHYDRQQR